MDGLSRTCKLLLLNTITTTVEARQRQKRRMITQIKLKPRTIINKINNKKNKSNKTQVEIQLSLWPTWNQK